MLSLLNPTTLLVALLALLGAFGAGWYKGGQEEKGKAAQALQKAVDAGNQRAQDAADKYETWKSQQQPKIVTKIREVTRAVQADTVCADKPLPPGLRAALASQADGHQSEPAGPMPAASSAGAFDLGSAGRRLFGSAGGTARLRGTP